MAPRPPPPPRREAKSPEPSFPRSEAPTKPKNLTASIYQSLLTTFDSMEQEQRMEFAEVVSVYSGLDESARKSLGELLRVYGTLTPDDRQELTELAVRFALTAPR